MTLRLLLFASLFALQSGGGGAAEPAFHEVAAQLGIDHLHFNGMVGKLYFAEHMGPGVAVLDYDNDGDLDVYLGQGNMLDDSPPEQAIFPPGDMPLHDRLFKNMWAESEGASLRFEDVSKAAGLETTTGYNMGAAVADFDNDGWPDLYLTNLGANQLLRNQEGRFVDVTAAAGADDRQWSVPASFFDYDRDGHLDLFVGNYVEFRAATHKNCASPQGSFDYCGPLAYPGQSNRLLHNLGDGRFEDVTLRSLLDVEPRNSLGTVAADFNGDLLLDLYVANDMQANELWLNQGDGTFFDEADLAGAAVDVNGNAQASMGLVAGDLNGDGSIDLFMTHLLRERNTLYLNDGAGNFEDATKGSGLGQASWHFTGFGSVTLDYDSDRIQDLFIVNGAVLRSSDQLAAGDPHPMRETNLLFRGLGGGRFAEVPAGERVDVERSEVSRGLAAGDLDNDGDLDLVHTNNAGPTRVLVNQGAPSRWVGVRLLTADGRRDHLGARARVLEDGGEIDWLVARTDGSYGSASDPRLLFALGAGADEVAIQVQWLDGSKERFTVPVRSYSDLRQGAGQAVEGQGG